MPQLQKVRFFFERKGFTLEQRSGLKMFLESMFKKEGVKLSSINFIFSSDKRLLEINKQYLRHDYFTDIITFELSAGGPVEAEVYISIDRVRDNSKKLGVSFKSELHRVIFHGVLHLCGYKDNTVDAKLLMRNKEEHFLEYYFR